MPDVDLIKFITERELSNRMRLSDMREAGMLSRVDENVFDDAVKLCARLLNVPVSLVSMVDADRQFFKAQTGLGAPWNETRETPLSHSFCKHVVDMNAPLIVNDAREHELVKNNGAIVDLNVISYLGYPIRNAGGAVLGSFCVIDSKPRDWTEDDLETVALVARGVEAEVRRRLERSRADAVEKSLREIIRTVPVGIMIAETETGRILYSNDEIDKAANADTAKLGTVNNLDQLVARHMDETPVKAEDYPLYQAALLKQPVDSMMFKLETPDGDERVMDSWSRRICSDTLAISASVDVTDALRQKQTINSLETKLERILHSVSDAIVELDEDGNIVFFNSAFQKSAKLACDIDDAISYFTGKNFVDMLDYATEAFRNDLRQAIEAARLTGEPSVLVTETNQNSFYEVRVFKGGDSAILVMRNVTAEHIKTESREALLHELNHRIKNLFALTSGMIAMTSRGIDDKDEFVKVLRGRINALAAAHDMVDIGMRSKELQATSNMSMRLLLDAMCKPYRDTRDFEIKFTVDEIPLSPGSLTSLPLIFHELCTNAMKYGAFRSPGGKLHVSTRMIDGDKAIIEWHETCADPVDARGKDGFGSQFLDLMIVRQLGGSYESDLQGNGMLFRMTLPKSAL